MVSLSLASFYTCLFITPTLTIFIINHSFTLYSTCSRNLFCYGGDD